MAVTPDSAAFEAHRFNYDPDAIDQPLVNLIQTFYTFSDDKENAASWAACFTEDAVMKKTTTDVQGREEIAKVNLGSWTGQASRQHIVFHVFPADAGGKPNEVMLYGMTKWLYEDKSTAEMNWAARLKFKRFDDGRILNTFYHIYPGGAPKPT